MSTGPYVDRLATRSRCIGATALVLGLLALFSLPARSSSKTPPTAPVPQDRGALFLYFEASAEGTAPPRLLELAVVRADGTAHPLSLKTQGMGERVSTRTGRIASSALAPGQYSGIQIDLANTTADEAKPAHPAPLVVDFPFTIHRGEGVVLVLWADLPRPVDEQESASPTLRVRHAKRPPAALLGLASVPSGHELMLFDKTSGEVAGVIPTGREPMGMALDTIRGRAYVALRGEDSVIAVGTREYRTLSRLRLRGGDEPVELALTPDSRTLLSANAGSRSVSFVDPSAMVETDRVSVGDQPSAILIGPLGERAYVLNAASSSVTVIDISARAILATIATEAQPFRARFNRTGNALFVAHRFSPFLSVIDPLSFGVTRRLFVGGSVTALEVDPRTDLIYLASQGSKVIEVYDPISLLPIDSISVGGEVSFLKIDGEEKNLHILLPQLEEVQILRLVGKGEASRFEVGDAYWLSLFGER